MNYHIITFGCQMNKSDSERIAGFLEGKKYKSAPKEKEADLIVVNMCSVRQSAVDRIYGLTKKLKELKAEKPELKTVLTGCLLKEDKKKLKNDFDFILEIKNLSSWPEFPLQNFNSCQKKIKKIKPKKHLEIQPKHQNNFSFFIPISNGCNNFCSYCVVPFARGSLVCRDHKKIIKEIKSSLKEEKNPIRNKISNGAKEIWLLGQNVNDYCSPADPKINFTKLIKMINNIPANFKFFFLSPHPKNFSGELIEALSNSEKFGKYLNLPLQSGSDKILKKMNRNYTAKEYKNLVKKIREKIAQIKLSTDIIVGFPKETKGDFQKTASLFKEIKFDWAYIAKYSPRPQTAAFKMKDNVSWEEKKQREKILRKILKKDESLKIFTKR